MGLFFRVSSSRSTTERTGEPLSSGTDTGGNYPLLFVRLHACTNAFHSLSSSIIFFFLILIRPAGRPEAGKIKYLHRSDDEYFSALFLNASVRPREQRETFRQSISFEIYYCFLNYFPQTFFSLDGSIRKYLYKLTNSIVQVNTIQTG